MSLTQKHRLAVIDTSLGEDVLVLQSMTGTESLGRLYRFEVVLLSEEYEIKHDDIIGQNVTIRLQVANNKTRYFNGYVSRFVQTTPIERYACYHATIVPWFWFLTRTTDCRIFQNKTVPDIIEEVFKTLGFHDYQRSLVSSYRLWEYCVQYRETHFDFVSRLMEQEGIYYFFKHENGKHTLVLADSRSAHEPFPGYAKISCRPPGKGSNDYEHIRDWSLENQVLTNTYTHTDFDFEKPKTELCAESFATPQDAAASFEVFDYPGEYNTIAEGETYAKIRAQELRSRRQVFTGQTDARGVGSGFIVEITDCPRESQNKEHLIISAAHRIESDVFSSSADASASTLTYNCTFSAIDVQTDFRSERTTPKPYIRGPQTAIVVGPTEEEIYTDKYGRVKVRFHWDRYSRSDENSSCWIRVASVWAGKKWGGIYIPRIGQEVIVEFLEGDPDHPIITGRVYNAEAMPPYELPAEKTKSTLKSLSSKGGGGFNEIRFEDKKGEEEVFIHAERNEDVRIKSECKEWVGKDRHLIVQGDQLEQVVGDKHLTVHADQNEKVNGTVSQNVGANLYQKVEANHALDAGQEIHLKAGTHVVIEAGASITIKAGGGFLVVGPAGVALSGNPVLINSGGSAGSGSGSSPDAPKLPKEAGKAQPGDVTPVKPGSSFQATVLQEAAKDGTPLCEMCAASKTHGASSAP